MEDQNILEIIKLIWPLIILQYGLAIWAIIDIVKKNKTRNLNPVIWILICLFINLVGPIIYILVGRTDE